MVRFPLYCWNQPQISCNIIYKRAARCFLYLVFCIFVLNISNRKIDHNLHMPAEMYSVICNVKHQFNQIYSITSLWKKLNFEPQVLQDILELISKLFKRIFFSPFSMYRNVRINDNTQLLHSAVVC